MAIDTSFLNHLDRLSLIINKRITSNYTGERMTEYTGKGLVFKDYIIYAEGDDFRTIDWKVYGRTDKLFVKRFEEERNLIVHVIIDFSASMDFTSTRVKKSEYASMLALGFAYMAFKNNERFVVSTFAEKLEHFRPRRGKKQLMAMLEFLNSKRAKGTSKLAESMAAYKKLIQTKSLIVIISDFLYTPADIQSVLHRFKQHEIKLVQVLDPIETELSLDGDFKLRDLESNDVLRTFISAAARKAYLENLSRHQAAIRKACDEVGAQFYAFSTSTPIFEAFYNIVQHTHGHR